MTREIEIDLNDWNFSRSIEIQGSYINYRHLFLSDELRALFSLDLSYSLNPPGIREKWKSQHLKPLF